MSEEERDVLVNKRKYWTKLMKYNLVGTIFLVIYFFVFRMLFHSDIGLFPEAQRIISESLFVVGSILMIFIIIAWPLSFIMYGYQSFKIYKINRKESLEQRQRQHEVSKDLTLDSSTTSVSSAVGTTGQETRREIGNVLGSLESDVVFKTGIILMAIYALSILFIDNPYVACTDSDIEELADCMNQANLSFKVLSFMGAIGLILSLIGIYTKPPLPCRGGTPLDRE